MIALIDFLCLGEGMNKGDHLQVDFGFYRHHGIDMGDGFVIHFGRGLSDLANAKVEIVSKAIFARGRPIEVVDGTVGFSATEIVDRARSRMGETDYDLFENNCEHFVTWCRTGVSASPQIETSETVVRQATAVAAKPVLRRVVANRLTKSTGSKLAIKLSTRTTGAAIFGDATQAVAELVANSIGKDQVKARRIGLGTGAATSAVVGSAIGGPLGGATTLGLWLAGQVLADQAVAGGKRVFTRIVSFGTQT